MFSSKLDVVGFGTVPLSHYGCSSTTPLNNFLDFELNLTNTVSPFLSDALVKYLVTDYHLLLRYY